jgi:hypothetical protein
MDSQTLVIRLHPSLYPNTLSNVILHAIPAADSSSISFRYLCISLNATPFFLSCILELVSFILDTNLGSKECIEDMP